MDQSAPRTDEVPVPTAGQVLVRTLPATAITAIGIPLAVWWLLDSSGEIRAPWWPLVLAALVTVPLAVHHLFRAPRPRRDKSVNPQRVKAMLEKPERPGVAPEGHAVRTVAGVTACDRIEAATISAGLSLAILVLLLTRGDSVWTMLTVVFGFFAVIHVVRARRGWAYLRALHAAERTG